MKHDARKLSRTTAVLAAITAIGAAGGAHAQAAGNKSFADRCSGTVALRVGPGTVDSVKLIPEAPDFPQTCQLIGHITTSPTSTINFHIDLPDDATWNGKFVQIGGGGYNGVIRGPELLENFNSHIRAKGYAFASSDGGVQKQDLSQALNDESVLNNFAYGYQPQVLEAAMAALGQFYGRPPSRKYFFGISTGGREALLQAQRYPGSYDGIIAMEPVVDYDSVIQRGIQLYKLAEANGGAGWLTPAKVKLYNDAQLAACDGLDGLKDGIISNVRACRFEPAKLRCPDGSDKGDACLSDAQVATLEFIRKPFRLPVPIANGITMSPAWGIGADSDPAVGISTHLMGDGPQKPGLLYFLSTFWLKYAVASDPALTIERYQPGMDAARWQQLSAKVNATNPDLAAFEAHGGKLLLAGGESDHLVPPGFGIDYYNSVVSAIGQARADKFFRFYMLPGVGHGWGPAPTDVDWIDALDHWVELGQAPQTLIASGNAITGTGHITRPVCRYPAWPKYEGSGDPSSSASFVCSLR